MIDPADSLVYGHLWATDETRDLLGDRGRTRCWLRIIGELATAQGELGLIPEEAAREIAAHADDELDGEAVGAETRRSGHSMLGLIRVLQRELSPGAREWVCHGLTVQDVTDTWTALVMQRMLRIAERDLAEIHGSLVGLADSHRGTVMLGRTHGQPGLPITFGFKAAVWADELARHRERLGQARPRLAAGQLAGAVGTLSAWGGEGLELQRRVLTRVGLDVPAIGWTSARDRVAEFATLLALVTGSLAKVGNEIYNLQRAEIAELAETPDDGVVGSITMPQKRNPERSEHLWTLARVVRSQADLAIEGLVAEHERDGAAWKTEWALVPRACAATAAALALAVELLAGLQVDAARMRANVDAQQGYVLAERVVLALAPTVGHRRAHELVRRVSIHGRERGWTLLEALTEEPAVTEHLPVERLERLLRAEPALDEQIDRVLRPGP